jgi:hypothetical protein
MEGFRINHHLPGRVFQHLEFPSRDYVREQRSQDDNTGNQHIGVRHPEAEFPSVFISLLLHC